MHDPLPAQAVDVCMWIASLAARPLRAATIDNYRWALHSLHTELALSSIVGAHPQIKRMIEGVKKTQGSLGSRPPRLPVTPAVIRAVTLLLDPGTWECPPSPSPRCGSRPCVPRLTRARVWLVSDVCVRQTERPTIACC